MCVCAWLRLSHSTHPLVPRLLVCVAEDHAGRQAVEVVDDELGIQHDLVTRVVRDATAHGNHGNTPKLGNHDNIHHPVGSCSHHLTSQRLTCPIHTISNASSRPHTVPVRRDDAASLSQHKVREALPWDPLDVLLVARQHCSSSEHQGQASVATSHSQRLSPKGATNHHHHRYHYTSTRN